ncbi:hypothetical protein GCM10009118_07310 [Wandonia haliotis]|uniref:DUF6443 domain-containing protein n=1 Tax=Wandonia haliotis TaxID=574963 RepID=A0ABN1MN44_9FLAO
MKKILTLFFLFLATGVYSQQEIYTGRLEGAAVAVGLTALEVKDGKYDDLNSALFTTHATQNAVVLSIEEGLTSAFLSAHATEVDITLTGYDDLGAPYAMGAHTLSVAYDPGSVSGATQHRHAHLETNGYPWVRVDITEVRVGGVPVSTAPENVTLEMEIAVERYYPFDTDLVPGVLPHNLSITFIDEGGTLHTPDAFLIYWDYIEGAVEYDLEWTFVEAFESDGSLSGASIVPFSENDFRKNATRIRTRNQYYRIENIFEKGYLVYRIRGIGKGGSSFTANLLGRWSTFVAQTEDYLDGFPHYLTLTGGHEGNKNWQYSAVYAEEGKRKDVISYFDGSLRNRQTVSLLNTQKEAIVGETIYDGIGRPVVQVLPVPTLANGLEYYENFNRPQSEPTRAYNYKDFDAEPVSGLGSCQRPTVGELSALSGAGRYYSPSADLRSKAHDYVPDANGYAFTQVEHTPDNTGRIKRQSGVGGDFTLEGNHHTQYFYGKPTQEELDRLFGADVGYNQHYKKNMVIDPNGQVSVSYVDAHGRTIATAMAGSVPGSMDSLRNEQGEALSVSSVLEVDELAKVDSNGDGYITDEPDSEEDDNQLKSSGNYIHNDILTTENSVVVTENNPNFTFNYDLNAAGYTDSCMNEALFPYIYDLSISMVSECGGSLLDFPSRTVGPNDMNLPLGNHGTAPTSVAFDATDGLMIDYGTGLNVPAGTYHISKKLQVNRDAVEYFADRYIEQGQVNGCILELDDFIAAYEAEIQAEGCAFDCESCRTSLGTLGTYAQQMFAADNIEVTLDGNGDVIVPSGEEDRYAEFVQEYAMLEKECDDLCGLNQSNLCASLYNQMLNDVKPRGQYGAVTGDKSLSVFTTSNNLLSAVNWKNPSSPYLDENGNEAWVYVHQNEDLSYSPQVDNPGVLLINEEGIFTRPENITHLSDFIDQWQDSWAASLVEAHPEYCYYDWCTSSSSGGYGQTNTVGLEVVTSQDVDNIFMSIPSYSEATSGNYLNGLDVFDFSALIAVDPFFSGNTDLSNLFNNYHTFENTVTLDILEFAIFVNTEGYIVGAQPSATPGYYNWSFVSSNYPHQFDVIWSFYKGLVLASKQKLLKPLAHEYALDNGCFNGCFGTAIDMNTFNPFINAFWAFTGTFPTLMFNMALMPQPCDILRFQQYKNKRPVWFPGNMEGDQQGDVSSHIGNSIQNTNNILYEQTGVCPLAFDLKNLLNAVINDATVSSTQLKTASMDLVGKPYFPVQLQSVLGVTPPLAPTGVFFYDATISSSSTLSIGLGDISDPCLTELTLPNYSFATNNLDWNNYLSTWKIYSFGSPYFSQEISGVYHFTVTAYVDRDLGDPYNAYDEVVLSGTTCLMVGNCDQATPGTLGGVTDNCRLSELGAGLQDLLIQLHGTVPGGLEPTSPPYTLSSDNFLNNALLNHYSSGVWTLSMESSYPNSRIYSLKNGLHNLKIVTHNWLIPPASVTAVQGISPMMNNNFYLNVTDHTPANEWDPSMSYAMDGSLFYNYNGVEMEKPRITWCGPCEGAEFDMNAALLENMEAAFTGTSSIPDAFYSYFGTENISMTALQTLTGDLRAYYLLDALTGDTLCEVQIRLTGSSGGSSTPVQIRNILPYREFGENGFQVDVQLENGNWMRAIGKTSCIKVAACPCQPEPIPPMSCESAYGDYTAKMTEFGGDYLTYQLSFADFCAGDYLNHIENYLNLLDAYHDYYGVATPYITLEDYINCRLDDYVLGTQEDWEAYNDHLVSIGLPTIPYSEYQQVGSCDLCKDLYEDVRLNPGLRSLAPTLAEVCNYRERCPGLPADVAPPIVVDTTDNYDCIDYLRDLAAENANYAYEQYIQDLRERFIAGYISGAVTQVVENFTSERPDNEYHYTLYYYDQAGNLVRTVPPKGVKRMDTAPGWAATRVAIGQARLQFDPLVGYSAGVLPQHELPTTYAYNALNQLVWQHTPDGGESNFWYDALGRIVASQNARQQANHLFSYTKFDAQGRVIEAGQLQGSSGDVVAGELQVDVNDATYPDNWTMNRTEVTRTIYDGTLIASPTWGLNFRNRIGSVIQQEALNTNLVFRSAYHYEYDMHGNVRQMQQDFRTDPSVSGSGITATMTYDYDLISGNVKQVKYQTPSELDLFYHRYYYDADNRITEVETSRDGYFWNTDAEYIYFAHGPLARVEIANDKVQGIDYAYTIQGWIKGVNAPTLSAGTDMGSDGKAETGNPNRNTARDAFGYALTYYDGDYAQIRTTAASPNLLGDLTTALPVGASGLFNGNIAQMATALRDENENELPLLAAMYSYDQLNRIKSMSGNLSGTGAGYSYAAATGGNYASTYQYDANGNLKTLTRRNSAGTLMDNFTYHYNANTNQLNYVADPAGSLGDDLDNQSVDNYTYDAIG